MKINYGDNGEATQETLPAPQSAPTVYQSQPPVAPPRIGKIFSAGFYMFFGMVLLALALFGTETLAPADYKPSAMMGGYQGRFQAEIRAHELETQAKYDAWMQQAQISIAQQQFGYQGQVQAVIASYQATYERARLFSDATARIQQDYAHVVLTQKQQQQAGSTKVVSMAQVLADIVRPFSPDTAEKIDDYADDVSGRLRDKLDASIQQGVTIDVAGWNTGLPSPEQVRADLSTIKPIVIPPPPHISRDRPAGQN